MSKMLMEPSSGRWRRSAAPPLTVLLLALAVGPWSIVEASAAAERTLDAIVQVTAHVPNDARTASSLGTTREGSGVVIDNSGLVLTIGYLILEADEVEISGVGPSSMPARIVAYDHESGFGLLRAEQPLDVPPVPFGRSADVQPREPMMVVSRAGEFDAAGVYVVDRRDFAGYWEYLLEDAIFTAPPHGQFGGAALINKEGRLIGIGSLIVPDAAIGERPIPGNMFVPIDQLKPILADLLSRGRRADPGRPWLGLTLEEHQGRIYVKRVSPDGPAAAAGIAPSDLILGIDGVETNSLPDFYRSLWSRGDAGIKIPLNVLKGLEVNPVVVKSRDRYDYLRLNPTY